ncbi:uncharacterized protein METZ01_LOCUS289757, partial [marine metagenome]
MLSCGVASNEMNFIFEIALFGNCTKLRADHDSGQIASDFITAEVTDKTTRSRTEYLM